MQIDQNIYQYNNQLKKLFEENNNRSLSGLFKIYRKKDTLSMYGDWLILHWICRVLKEESNKLWTRGQIRTAWRITDLEREDLKILCKDFCSSKK